MGLALASFFRLNFRTGGSMKGRICLATCAAFVLATTMAVLAQDPASPQSTASASAKTITVTGCVKRAEERAAGTTGATTTTATEAKFVLTNATVKTDETAATSGTTTPPATAI